MKFTPEVIAALQVLRDNAVNDFERHRIDVLERDLTAPPTVEIIDDMHQRFNGVTYRRDKGGHYSKMIFIHQSVWRYAKGDIPETQIIHHINENKGDNSIQNLQCVTTAEHCRIHRSILQKYETTCQVCGKPISITTGQKFCSSNCRRKADAVTRICMMCGHEFKTNKYHEHFLCSNKCARDFQYKNNRETRTCPICGKKFIVKKSSHKKCCSRKCGCKHRWGNKNQ